MPGILKQTEFWFKRSLAFIYLIAFLITANQFIPLLGEHGLLPVRLYLPQTNFAEAPSLFWWDHSDRFITTAIWCGVGLSAIALTGIFESPAVWALLWILYLSLVNIGQVFYGFGWEMILLETGFLAIFLGGGPAPRIVFWLVLWELFRIMFGAGMIKLRGDPCWRDLTCLFYHYETQPLPNPLSWYFHHLPQWWHKACVLFTHFGELIVPWFYFAPWRRVRAAAGLITIYFQFTLILSGNLSWLNHITIALCIPCFADMKLRTTGGKIHYLLAIVIGLLSVQPALNLFSRRQMMNASFEPLHLVNTYGAFGAVGRQRPEIVIEGTDDGVTWCEYEFKGKPGNPLRRPCIVSPYHYKLDWQMWFAAMDTFQHHPWIVNLVAKLLQNDRATLSLLAGNPFPDKPPRYVRATLYLYHFTDNQRDGWWRRERLGEYLPALSLDDPAFRQVLKQQGWLDDQR